MTTVETALRLHRNRIEADRNAVKRLVSRAKGRSPPPVASVLLEVNRVSVWSAIGTSSNADNADGPRSV